ncbi:aldehyde dehydrogenase family protein [Mycolicibacterium palauense]|uniref:aldehyde dehydrogenase family protein n=1 Tax=Mycolicibacterium palauense TaxID=2034511 RepID=UPI000BFF16C4|nr:aldehyde dehydrogenase family protein [Mycolicibacterium palauense]
MTSTASISHTFFDIPKTVADLRGVYDSERTRPVEWRRSQLRALERMMRENEAAITDAVAADLGRPRSDVYITDIAPVVAEASFAYKRVHRWMRTRYTGLPASAMPGIARYVYEPLGVVLVIGPWNYPFYLTVGPLVAALAAGNCVAIKPSEHAPRSSRLLVELVGKYLDNDAVTVVEGGPDVTQELIDEGVDHVFFTGGTEVGRLIMQAAARHLTPVTLELGGKSPVVVMPDADLEVAARRIAWMKFINSGQTCVAPDYVLAHREVRDALVERIIETIPKFRQGEPSDLKIVNSRQFERLRGALEASGGTVVCGGRADADRVRMEPTVVLDPERDSPLMTDEIFGPILPVCTIDDLDGAIRHIKRGPKPLAMSMFGGSARDRRRIERSTSSGGIVFNHVAMHCLVPQLPFGGVGASGIGSYHGKWGFEQLSHRKALLHKPTWPDPAIMYPPYTDKKLALFRRFL